MTCALGNSAQKYRQLKLILTEASNEYYRFVAFYLCIMFWIQKILVSTTYLDKLYINKVQ